MLIGYCDGFFIHVYRMLAFHRSGAAFFFFCDVLPHLRKFLSQFFSSPSPTYIWLAVAITLIIIHSSSAQMLFFVGRTVCSSPASAWCSCSALQLQKPEWFFVIGASVEGSVYDVSTIKYPHWHFFCSHKLCQPISAAWNAADSLQINTIKGMAAE